MGVVDTRVDAGKNRTSAREDPVSRWTTRVVILFQINLRAYIFTTLFYGLMNRKSAVDKSLTLLICRYFGKK